MSQRNLAKINSIVDKIVEGNDVLKLKSVIEQDKEKDSMVKSINSAVSVLNESGQEIVLADLSVDPEEKFKGVIDGTGNIDISELIKFTTTIVKATIEQYEREGINLTNNNIPSHQTNYNEMIVSAYLIDKMNKDFNSLSDSELSQLINNFSDLSYTDKKSFIRNFEDQVKNDSNLTKKQQKIILEFAELSSLSVDISNFMKENKLSELSENDIEDLIKKYKSEYPNTSDEKLEEILKFLKTNIGKEEKYFADLSQDYIRISTRLRTIILENLNKKDINKITIANSKQIAFELIEELQKNLKELDISEDDFKKIIDSLIDKDLQEEHQKIVHHVYSENLKEESIEPFDIAQHHKIDEIQQSYTEFYPAVENPADNNKPPKVSDIESQDALEDFETEENNSIAKISQLLTNNQYSKEEILEAFETFQIVFESLDEEDLNDLSKQSSAKCKETFLDVFESNFKEQMTPASYNTLIAMLDNFPDSYLDKLIRDPQLIQDSLLVDLSNEIERLGRPIKDEHLQEGIDNSRVSEETLDATAAEAMFQQMFDGQEFNFEDVETEDATPEFYSFIDSEYLQQDSQEGLIPRNGGNSKSLQDEKTAIFYSQGKEGAIVMYFEFLRKYHELSGARGDKALQEYANYQNGITDLSEEKAQQLLDQIKQITEIRESSSFDEFMGDKLYLSLNGIDTETDKQDAADWKKAHPEDVMDYNYANSWTIYQIPPDRIDVMTLQNATGTDVRMSQKDLIMYFLSQTSIENIDRLGVNDTTLEYIKQFSQEHSEEIARLGADYSLVPQNIQEVARNQTVNDKSESSPTPLENATSIEQNTQETTALEVQDNSFIGKVKRVMANMRALKDTDNSKGFFNRLSISIQSVFGTPKEESQDVSDNIDQHSNQGAQPVSSFEEQLRQGVDQSKFNQLPTQEVKVDLQKGKIVEEDGQEPGDM